MDVSTAIRTVYDWAKSTLRAAGYSIVENPAVPPRTLDNHVLIWVEGADFRPTTLGRSYSGSILLLVQAFKGVSTIPLLDSVSAVQALLSALFSSMPSEATTLRLSSIDLGTSKEYVAIEVRIEVGYDGLTPV